MGGLSAGASIGVTTENLPKLSAPIVIATGDVDGASQFFFSDLGLDVGAGNGAIYLTISSSPWMELQAQLDLGGVVVVATDCSARSFDASLTVTNAVVLDLAGHTLTGAGNKEVIRVDAGGSLTLTNSVPESGAIQGGKTGVIVYRNGVFTMAGGRISGNSDEYGGGVYVNSYSSFTMSGGEICGNTADELGGGVQVDWYGQFTMTGGEISGNTAAERGGGVFMGGYSTFAFAADIGGGIYMSRQCDLSMTGGEMSGNAADVGGGVYIEKEFHLVSFSGRPVVSGNTNSTGVANNVWLPEAKKLSVDRLADGAAIGLSTEVVPTSSAPVAVATGAVDRDVWRFFSDVPGFHLEMVDGSLCLVEGYGLPAYLADAHELVVSNYYVWAAKYGRDVYGTHETAFLLDIDPATPIPEGASLLKVVDFSLANNFLHLEVESDVTEFRQKDGEAPFVGNGLLVLYTSLNASSPFGKWAKSTPAPAVIRNGRVVLDAQLAPPGYPMPPCFFMRPAIVGGYGITAPLSN